MLKAGLLGLGTIGSIHYSEGYKEIMANDGPVRLEACFDITPNNLDVVEGVANILILICFLKAKRESLIWLIFAFRHLCIKKLP